MQTESSLLIAFALQFWFKDIQLHCCISVTMSHEQNPSKLVQNTRKTFKTAVTKNVNNRLKYLKNFNKFLHDNEEQIITAMHEDLRKHREEARQEIFIAINHVRYLIDNLRKWEAPEHPPKRFIDLLDGLYVYNDPYGVVLVMCAWNVPLLTLVPATGAIAAGNCVVIKPSHNSPSFGSFLAATLPKYLDPNCFPVFLGGSEETKMLLDERFDYIYYTGSTTFGKFVHSAANKFLTPTTLEMGGKNPVYIDSSVDLELTARRVMWGKCFNSGQACISPDYILCTKSVEEEFIKHAKTALDVFYKNSKSCPIINDQHFRRLQGLLAGLKVALGGQTDSLGNYIEPTIVTDIPADHAILKEEIFGPILPIITIDNVKQAVDYINRKEKPLVIYIFTKKSSVRDYLIDNTSSGAVTVNDTLMHLIVENLPFGGVGLSGMGRYKGKYSFDTFVHKKSVLLKNSWKVLEKINELRYPPYSSRKSDVSEFLLQYRGGFSWSWVGYCMILLVGVFLGFLIVYFFNVSIS